MNRRSAGAWAGGWPGELHLCRTLTSCGNSLVKTFVFCFLVMKIFLKRWMKPFCFEALKALLRAEINALFKWLCSYLEITG